MRDVKLHPSLTDAIEQADAESGSIAHLVEGSSVWADFANVQREVAARFGREPVVDWGQDAAFFAELAVANAFAMRFSVHGRLFTLSEIDQAFSAADLDRLIAVVSACGFVFFPAGLALALPYRGSRSELLGKTCFERFFDYL